MSARKKKQSAACAELSCSTSYPAGSAEATAIKVLHDVVGRTSAFYAIFRRGNVVSFTKPITVQLVAFAQAPERDAWVTLNHRQAGAWEGFFREVFDQGVVRQHFRAGSRAPWIFPPSVEGKLYPPGTDPPLMTREDLDEEFQ